MKVLKVGEKAPDFKGIIQTGETVSLSDYKGKKLVIYFYPKDNQYLSVSGEYYGNSLPDNDNNYFMNLGYQFTFKKPKMDLNISWRNILDTDQYINVNNNQYYNIISRCRLRPSQMLASLKFTL